MRCPNCRKPRFVWVAAEEGASYTASADRPMVIACQCEQCGSDFSVTISVAAVP